MGDVSEVDWVALRPGDYRPSLHLPTTGPGRQKVLPAVATETKMNDGHKSGEADDPYDLNRFVRIQAGVYAQALTEIRRGQKTSHWMWYVFPQIDGLGFSETTKRYSIKSVEETRAYLQHPLLGPRLVECAEAALQVEGRSAHQIFGSPDDGKLRSCATLFASVSPAGSVFHQLLDHYFEGARDEKTLELLDLAAENN